MLRYLFNLTESDYNIIVEAEWFLLTNPQEKDVIMDAKTLVTCLNALPAAQAVLIRGDHGVGKSQLVHQLAKRRDLELIDVRASTMSEGDVVGYPDLERTKETGVASFALPSWYVRACNEPCILFLDELNRGLPGVLNSMFQIVLDRELGSGPDGKPKRLHPGTQVVAAVNWGGDYTVSEMDQALLSRFWVAEFKPSVEDWIVWAKTEGDINELLVDFIRLQPAHLRPTKAVEPGKVAPNQRSWAMLDRALKAAGIELTECGGNPPAILYPLSLGFVGVEASAALVDFVKNYSSVITAEDVLDRWSKVKTRIGELSTERNMAIIEKIKDHSKENKWTLSQAGNLKKFFDVLTGECKMALHSGVMSSDNSNNIKMFHGLVKDQIMSVIQAAQAINDKKK